MEKIAQRQQREMSQYLKFEQMMLERQRLNEKKRKDEEQNQRDRDREKQAKMKEKIEKQRQETLAKKQKIDRERKALRARVRQEHALAKLEAEKRAQEARERQAEKRALHERALREKLRREREKEEREIAEREKLKAEFDRLEQEATERKMRLDAKTNKHLEAMQAKRVEAAAKIKSAQEKQRSLREATVAKYHDKQRLAAARRIEREKKQQLETQRQKKLQEEKKKERREKYAAALAHEAARKDKILEKQQRRDIRLKELAILKANEHRKKYAVSDAIRKEKQEKVRHNEMLRMARRAKIRKKIEQKTKRSQSVSTIKAKLMKARKAAAKEVLIQKHALQEKIRMMKITKKWDLSGGEDDSSSRALYFRNVRDKGVGTRPTSPSSVPDSVDFQSDDEEIFTSMVKVKSDLMPADEFYERLLYNDWDQAK